MSQLRGTAFRGTEGLWELLTRKNVNTELIGKEDLKTKKIIGNELNRYQLGDNINITQGEKFRDVIRPLFSKPKRRGFESALSRKWVKY